MKSLHILPFAPLLLGLVQAAHGQTFQWAGPAESIPQALWSTGANWSPTGPPTAGSTVIVDRLGFTPGTGPLLDLDATLANLQVRNGGFVGNFESGVFPNTVHTLTVTGTTQVGPGFGYFSVPDGCVYTLGTFLSQSNATLLYGAVIGGGNNTLPGPGPAILQWRGANIVRNEGSIGLNPGFVVRDQDTGLDALRNFSQNGGLFGVGGRTYTTPGAFTNAGLLTVSTNSSVQTYARLNIGGPFLNFDPGTGVLNGGQIQVKGRYGGRAEFAFPGANIRTLAPFTSITLEGDAAVLDSDTGENGLRQLGVLQGDLSIANALGLTPSGGTFTHTNGNLHIATNGALTVNGDFEQQPDGSIRLGQNATGTARLTITGNTTLRGEFLLDGDPGANIDDTHFDANLYQVFGSLISGSGTTQGEAYLGGVVRPGRILTSGARGPRSSQPARPEGASVVAGRLRLLGGVVFGPTGTLSIGIGGPNAFTDYSVLEQQGPAGLVLAGTLAVTVDAAYTPPPSASFVIVRCENIDGTFSNVADGGRINTDDGRGSFRVFYEADATGGRVVLTDFELSTVTVFVGGAPLAGDDWSPAGNWNNGLPGTVVSDAVIPSGRYTTASADFPGLGALTLRRNSGVTLVGPVSLEFLGGIILAGGPGGSAVLNHAGPGLGTLVTNRLTLAPDLFGDPDAYGFGYVQSGLRMVQPGVSPAPLNLVVGPRGLGEIAADLAPFRGSTLTIEMQTDPATLSGSSLAIFGTISEVSPTPASPTGAALVIQGGGSTRLTGANTYTGGTTVRDSLLTFSGGSFLSGGLYAENTTGSATGSGPVTVTSTAGATAGSDNLGILAGNGRLGGDVLLAGSCFLPGNASTSPTSVGTLTLGGNLTLTSGPAFGGTTASSWLLDLDPQAADPALRTDLVLLSSASAVVQLQDVTLGVFLKSPPSPGQILRFLSALSAPNAVSGVFNGLPNGSTVNANYYGVNFSFVVQYGPNYVQLAHQAPPPVSYAYLRTFYFNAEQLSDPAISGPLAQFQANGIPNVLAYALGLDPKTATAADLPRAALRSVNGVPYPVLEIRRAVPRRPDLVYRVAETNDLAAGFGAAIDLDAPANAGRIVSLLDHGDGTQTVVVRATNPVASGPQTFLRFGVDYTP
ncbi:MAG: hypothetical protein JSR82_14435 [Verrucomicrobia bacterium]|nr:hypothetical protein [Verrucomicrobiota bacterium]